MSYPNGKISTGELAIGPNNSEFVVDSVGNIGIGFAAPVVSLDTDKNSDQIDLFGKQISMHIAASNPLALSSDQIEENILKNNFLNVLIFYTSVKEKLFVQC